MPSPSTVFERQLSISVDGNPTADDAKVDAMELAAARRVLKLIKSRVGSDGMLSMFSPDFQAGQELWDSWLEKSDGEFSLVKVEMIVKGLTLAEFEPYLAEISQPVHFAMHPEHLVSSIDAEGGVLTIGETEGELQKLFVMQVDEKGPIGDEFDSSCTYSFTGVMRNPAGELEACVLHQFKDTPDGLYAKVCGWNPAAASEGTLEAVYEHLAVEFANLLRMSKFDGELTPQA